MADPQAIHDCSKSSPLSRRMLLALLVLAGVLRAGLVAWNPDSLAEDRDMYWGLARRLATGDGFVHPVLGHPTAYRPPLYPLLLAAIVACGGGANTLAVIQVSLGIAATGLTWRLGNRLGLRNDSLISAAFVAMNPLLVQATSLAMTETLCSLLVLASFNVMSISPRDDSRLRPGWLGAFFLSALFGLTVLCRPSMLVPVLMMALVAILDSWRRGDLRRQTSFGLIIAITFALTLAPWGIRNARVFGTPIVTTTHGGYTLLLGNNDEAYRAEIAEADGSLWDARPWQIHLREQLADEGLRHDQEVAIDRRMTRLAWDWIRQHPGPFLESCWLRVKRFWSVSPQGHDVESLPKWVRWGISFFFVSELTLAILGVWTLRREAWWRWWPLIVFGLSLSAVHWVYWSNLRMRAPIEPFLALLAARGANGLRARQTLHQASS